MLDSQFPPGTAVCVRQTVAHRIRPICAQVAGVVEAWEEFPTGSWLAGGKNGKLWLKRLRLRKQDAEIALLVIDKGTTVSPAVTPPSDMHGGRLAACSPAAG